MTKQNLHSLQIFVLALTAIAIGCSAAMAQPAIPAPTAKALAVPADQFPGDDGVFVQWEQSYTLGKDGSFTRREHRWIKLFNSRPIDEFADPGIDFCKGEDELKIHTAAVHLQDGTTLPIAEYGFNPVGPDDVAGWPEYINWQETVVNFGGIENNCVLELDYEITTKPGVVPWIEADLRLHENYPTLKRVVTVTIPADHALRFLVTGMPTEQDPVKAAGEKGGASYRWTFENLAAHRGEAFSVPWQLRCGRLQFTTCPGAAAWVDALLKPVGSQAVPTDAIKKFAKAAAENEVNPVQRVEKAWTKFHDTFNFVDSHKTYRSLSCRSAEEVFSTNYGNPLEAAALLAATFKALELNVSVAVALDAVSGDPEVPMGSAFEGIVLVVDTPEGPVNVHPQQGIFHNPGRWGRHHLLSLGENQQVLTEYVAARGELMPSKLDITGQIEIMPCGKAKGTLHILLTGNFYEPADLDSSGAQESIVRGLVNDVVSGFTLKEHAITELSEEKLVATATIETGKPLDEVQKGRMLALAASGPAFLRSFPLPLGDTTRNTDVNIDGAFAQNVDIIVKLPDNWKVDALPAALRTVKGSWGSLNQDVQATDGKVRFIQRAEISAQTISPDELAPLRKAINTLKSPRSQILIVAPASKKSAK